MPPLTTEIIRIAFKKEAAYAAGNGTDKYECDPFEAGEVADLTVMNYPVEEIEMGKYEYFNEIKKPVGTGANTKKAFKKGIKYGTFKYICYNQRATWEQLAVAATSGTVGDSYVFHMEKIGIEGLSDYFDACGCVIIEYKKDVINDDFVKEEITWLYYEIVDSVAVTNLARCNFGTDAKLFSDYEIHISGEDGQLATGDVDMSGGHDWSGGGAETFTVDGTTVTLNTNCGDLAAVEAAITAALATALITHITVGNDGSDHIRFTSTAVYTLADGTGVLSTLGIDAGEYGLAQIDEVTDFDILITNTVLDMKASGKLQRMTPYLKSRDIAVNLKYYSDAAKIFGETLEEGSQMHDVYITDGTNYITITEMIVTEDNVEKIPAETDFHLMESKLEGGGVTVITVG